MAKSDGSKASIAYQALKDRFREEREREDEAEGKKAPSSKPKIAGTRCTSAIFDDFDIPLYMPDADDALTLAFPPTHLPKPKPHGSATTPPMASASLPMPMPSRKLPMAHPGDRAIGLLDQDEWIGRFRAAVACFVGLMPDFRMSVEWLQGLSDELEYWAVQNGPTSLRITPRAILDACALAADHPTDEYGKELPPPQRGERLHTRPASLQRKARWNDVEVETEVETKPSISHPEGAGSW